MSEHWDVIEKALEIARNQQQNMRDHYTDEILMQLDAALIFAKKQQLAERGEYVPVDVAFIRCDDGHYLQVEQQTVAVGPYGKHSVTAFDLPEPYYICRRVQREDENE